LADSSFSGVALARASSGMRANGGPEAGARSTAVVAIGAAWSGPEGGGVAAMVFTGWTGPAPDVVGAAGGVMVRGVGSVVCGGIMGATGVAAFA
jgi:hypothetical protein